MGIAVIPAAGGGVTQKVIEYTSTTNFVTPSNVTAVQVILVGAGGGGGFVQTSSTGVRGGGGGGGGEYLDAIIPVTAGQTYTVTIGAGGAASTIGSSNGGTGTNTTFGSLATAVGGGGSASRDISAGTYTYGTRSGGGFSNAAIGGGAGGGMPGGGAGSAASGQYVMGNSGTVAFFSQYNSAISVQTKQSNVGFTSSSASLANFGTIAGAGKYGFGNGGAGGFAVTAAAVSAWYMSHYSGTGAPGYFNSDTTTAVAGVAPTANTGDGGHGSTTNATALNTSSGTAGASGYAKVIYWS